MIAGSKPGLVFLVCFQFCESFIHVYVNASSTFLF